MEKVRERWVDICKGVAILLVVMGHVVTSYHNSNLLTDATGINFICHYIYTFHMPLFFVISGFLATKSSSTNSIKIQISRKIISYGVPYLFFSVAVWLLKFIASPFVNSKVGLTDLFAIFLYPINAMWFLYALLFISVIHICVKALGKEKKICKYINLTVALLVLILSKLLKQYNVLNIADLDGLFVFDVLEYYFYYEFGAYVLNHIFGMAAKMKVHILSRWAIIICALIANIGLVWIVWKSNVSNVALGLLLALGGTLLICAISKAIGECSLLELLGKQSMPIYLLHGYFISATRIAITLLGLPLLSGFLPLILCSVLGVGLSLFAYMVCMRVPFLDFWFYPLKYSVWDKHLRK